MTEKLYYKDAYIKEFTARVVSCEKRGDRFYTVLDRTAFFPEEGGQYSDTGLINGVRVTDVKEQNGTIYHETDSFIEVGDDVLCSLDFDVRYEKMQCHTAEHILSGLINSKYGFNNVGFHLGTDEVTMDISSPLTSGQLEEIERLANEVVYQNLEVTAIYPDKEEAKIISYRSKMDIEENLRIIKIGSVDSCACCAPHVRQTGEIGLIKILDYSSLRGGIRIRIAAGRRAMKIFVEMQKNLARISKLYSVPKLECADAAEKFAQDLGFLKAELKEFKTKHYSMLADMLDENDGSIVCVFNNASYDELRAYANVAKTKTKAMLVLLSDTVECIRYVIMSESVQLNIEIKKINAALKGKGGGNAAMVQGNFGVCTDDVLQYFENAYGARINRYR